MNNIRIDGVIFDKYQTTIIKCPENKAGEYKIPDNILFIEQEAFINCIHLSSIWLPNSLLSIGCGAFKDCSGLVSFNIPSKITYLHNGLLDGCINLREIHVHCVIPPQCISDNYSTSLYNDELMLINRPISYKQSDERLTCFNGINKATCKLYVPMGTVNVYSEAIGWREFENIIDRSL